MSDPGGRKWLGRGRHSTGRITCSAWWARAAWARSTRRRTRASPAATRSRFCFASCRTARITSLLQHPNIVQVIDHNSTVDGTSYLVMEFLAGESLAARLAREGRLAV